MAIKTFTGTTLSSSDVNTYLNNGGLVYITETTVAGAGYLQIDGCFTSTYTNYLAVFNGTTSSTSPNDVSFRFCTGGTPNTASLYFAALNYAANTSSSWAFYWQSLLTNGTITFGADLKTCFTMNIFSPQQASNTEYVSAGAGFGSVTSGAMDTKGLFYNTTQFDGLYIWQAGKTISGTLTIFGYRKS